MFWLVSSSQFFIICGRRLEAEVIKSDDFAFAKTAPIEDEREVG